MKTLRILCVLSVCAAGFASGDVRAQATGQGREVPGVLPETMRPDNAKRLPQELRPVDYFGRVKSPVLEGYDPFRSSFFRDGRDNSADRLEEGRILSDLSHKYLVQHGSLPTVAVTAGRAVSVLLMRHGRIIVPKFADILPPPENLVQVIPIKNSPYLYLQAHDEAMYGDIYRYTHVFIPMDLEGRPIQFQIRLKIVPQASEEILPLVILDMVGDFPDVFVDPAEAAKAAVKAETSKAAVEAGVSKAFNMAGAAGRATGGASGTAAGGQGYVFHGVGPTPLRAPFTRDEVRTLFPTMIEMAKLYEQAVYDGAPGYSKDNIVRFRPKSVKDGRVVSEKIPAFKNPLDGQIYYLPWGYYFPEYDAIVYELVFQNLTSRELWFDYALLKVLFGFDRSGDKAPRGPRSVVVSPESSEVTPPGRYNTFWVLAQGAGVHPLNTPVRFLFPRGDVSKRLVYGEGRVEE